MFDGSKCTPNQKWNNDKCWCECRNSSKNVCKKGHVWNSAIFSCENGIQKALSMIQWLRVMKLYKRQKVSWQKLFQQKQIF